MDPEHLANLIEWSKLHASNYSSGKKGTPPPPVSKKRAEQKRLEKERNKKSNSSNENAIHIRNADQLKSLGGNLNLEIDSDGQKKDKWNTGFFASSSSSDSSDSD